MGTWVGCAISMFQQLSGINAIMFYSSAIFASSNSSLSPNAQTALVQAVAIVSSTMSIGMLNFKGRKFLLTFWTSMCAVFMYLMALAVIKGWGNFELVMVMLFMACFQFAPGPIVWLYNGEILKDKGYSAAVTTNWLFTLVIALITPSMIGWSAAGSFLFFGTCNALGVVSFLLFMKETMGLTDMQVKYLYRKDRDVIKEFEDQ